MPDSRSPPAQPARLAAMQNPLDRLLYHPLAARLARALAQTAITPNMVSVAGAGVIVLAGLVYIQPGWPVPAVLGLALHMAWHVLDGADGDLARLTGRTSPNGEIVDGLCDYGGHVALYLLLGAASYDTVGWWAWGLAIPAGLSRILQASFYETQRRRYLEWVHGVPWLGSETRASHTSRLRGWGTAYLRVAGWLVPEEPQIVAAMKDPAHKALITSHLLEVGPAALAGSSLLGANYRTLALGGAMLAGSPLWFFAFEIVALNSVLAASVFRSRRTTAWLRSELA